MGWGVGRLGYVAYARAKPSRWTGDFVLAAGIDASVEEILLKLGVDPRPNSAVRDYNAGRTTQVPACLAYDVGRARIVRKLGVGKRMLAPNEATIDLPASTRIRGGHPSLDPEMPRKRAALPVGGAFIPPAEDGYSHATL